MTAPASIEQLITKLVQDAPSFDDATLDELVGALRRDARPLARSIARVVKLVGEQLVDAGIALPALAMACATLCDPRLGETEREAARFEIETLLPIPDHGGGAAPRFVIPDVPVTRLGAKKRTN
ncbi:MAG: hypothetical protein ACKV2T_03325 [Kofleriaceae bacterium]